jgi:DNA repair protein RadC
VLLQDYNNDVSAVAKLGVKELSTFKGVGPAKAISVIAALELGRRMKANTAESKPKITCSEDSYAILSASMEDLHTEVFKVILLNRNNRVIKISTISEGGVAGTVVDPKVIFKDAIDNLASAIILSHNHPSGNLKPSQADINITKKLVEAGSFLEIRVLDHVIISELGYYSFADEGMM